MKKDNELVTRGAVKKAIRKEMGRTWGFMCFSHKAMCGILIEAIDNLPIESEKNKPEVEHEKEKT